MSHAANVIGSVLMAAGGFAIAAALLILFSTLTGVYGASLFKDLLRVYHLRVIAYWLDRVEKVGVREFERAEQLDKNVQASKGLGADSDSPQKLVITLTYDSDPEIGEAMTIPIEVFGTEIMLKRLQAWAKHKGPSERRELLLELQEKWRQRAAKAFADAKLEQDPMGKRLIEHGAVCHFNCMMDVRKMLGLGLPGEPAGNLPLEVVNENGEGP